MAFCPLYVIGRVGMISMSLPAAIKLPVKVRNPKITSATKAPVSNPLSGSRSWFTDR